MHPLIELCAKAGGDAVRNLSEDVFMDEGSMTEREVEATANAVEEAIRALSQSEIDGAGGAVCKMDCTRSHPHENMDKCCELRTEIARLRNKLAQQDKAGIAAVTAAEYTRGREDGYEAGRMFERQADSSQGSSAADTKEG